jgi:uncharacterized Tic20 family protein
MSASTARVRRHETVGPAQRRAAAASHLSAAAAALLPVAVAGRPVIASLMTAFAGPLIVWLILGRRDGFVRRHAVAALTFNISVTLYLGMILIAVQLTTGSAYTIQAIPFLLFVNLLVVFNWLVFTIIAVHRAATGQWFTYPMTVRWSALRPRTFLHGRA